MTREDLIEILKERSATANDLAKEFNKSVAAIEDDLYHVRTSLRNDAEYQLMIRSAECVLCGYRFATNSPKTPSKCPECNKEKIRVASFKIERQ